ncbi:hypothetical protein AAG570_007456 [Ranatra chinensis]|uniref:Uncharacterized protein n=1 Tax=Ranatra chinensis TaxID=642074 RepID=A0ABD0XVX8_9HEMI
MASKRRNMFYRNKKQEIDEATGGECGPTKGLDEAERTSSEPAGKCKDPCGSNLGVYYNTCRAIEELDTLQSRYQERYVGYETDAFTSSWWCDRGGGRGGGGGGGPRGTGGRPLTASAKKRARLNGWAVSPGRRLSHLARRRTAFGASQLRLAAARRGGAHGILVDLAAKSKTCVKLPSAKKTTKSPAVLRTAKSCPKRALFQSPEDDATAGRPPKPDDSFTSPVGCGRRPSTSTRRVLWPSSGSAKKRRNDGTPAKRRRSSVSRSLSFVDHRPKSADKAKLSNTHKQNMFQRLDAIFSLSDCGWSHYNSGDDGNRLSDRSLFVFSPCQSPPFVQLNLALLSVRSARVLSPAKFTEQNRTEFLAGCTEDRGLQALITDNIQQVSAPPHPFYPLFSVVHIDQQKLLWAVSTALKGEGIDQTDDRFKQAGTRLYKRCGLDWLERYEECDPAGGSTSEAMLDMARAHLPTILAALAAGAEAEPAPTEPPPDPVAIVSTLITDDLLPASAGPKTQSRVPEGGTPGVPEPAPSPGEAEDCEATSAVAQEVEVAHDEPAPPEPPHDGTSAMECDLDRSRTPPSGEFREEILPAVATPSKKRKRSPDDEGDGAVPPAQKFKFCVTTQPTSSKRFTRVVLDLSERARLRGDGFVSGVRRRTPTKGGAGGHRDSAGAHDASVIRVRRLQQHCDKTNGVPGENAVELCIPNCLLAEEPARPSDSKDGAESDPQLAYVDVGRLADRVDRIASVFKTMTQPKCGYRSEERVEYQVPPVFRLYSTRQYGGPDGVVVSVCNCHAEGSGFNSLRGPDWPLDPRASSMSVDKPDGGGGGWPERGGDGTRAAYRLSEVHKKKLLWAATKVLQDSGQLGGSDRKSKVASLLQQLKAEWPAEATRRGGGGAGGTSDRMLALARRLLEGKGDHLKVKLSLRQRHDTTRPVASDSATKLTLTIPDDAVSLDGGASVDTGMIAARVAELVAGALEDSCRVVLMKQEYDNGFKGFPDIPPDASSATRVAGE